jgi:hypothetical protein
VSTTTSGNLRSIPFQQAARRVYRGATRRLNVALWSALTVISGRHPRLLLTSGGGLGDHLLCTAVFHELRQRGARDLWMASNHRALFRYNADIDRVVPLGLFFDRWARKEGGQVALLGYAAHIKAEDRDVPPARHIIACLCQQLGLTGRISLRPYMPLLGRELSAGELAPRQIAIQSSGLGAQYPMRNKEWYPERFQAVVAALKPYYSFVQVGAASDPLLEGAIDRRGKTSLRQTAAILSASLAFVGQVGFLMHLARAVDCRAVIVYGGRELPEQSGYTCNENLTTALPCAPCWRWNTCPYDRECMRRISAEAVVAAVERQIERYGQPLPVDRDTL